MPRPTHSGARADDDTAVPCAANERAVYVTALNSSRYLATPDTPAMACGLRTKTMNAASGMPCHWLARSCFEAGSNPNARVVLRVSDDNNKRATALTQDLQPSLHQLRADALSLAIR